MIEIRGRASHDSAATAHLTLPFELRQKSRLRARLDDGREVALFLPRGTVLRGGDRLQAEDGTVVEVRAAGELVTRASGDPHHLLRAAYHLGNRHVPVEIGVGRLRYGHDHVLDDMLRGLGLTVLTEEAPFEPEGGAYGGHSHAGHSHDGHSHDGHSHAGRSHDGHSHAGHSHGDHSHGDHSHGDHSHDGHSHDEEPHGHGR